MIIHFGLASLQAEWPSSAVTIGTFDGMHLGHQALLLETARQAKKHQIPSILLTFDRHPFITLFPKRAPLAISSLDEKLEIARQLGISTTVILAFDHELASKSAELFLNEILFKKLQASQIIVGHDFSFGNNRSGNAFWLQEKVSTTILEPQKVEGIRVSSQEIRRLIADGNVFEAKKFLGRRASLSGIVIKG